jgi:hypothetical protein
MDLKLHTGICASYVVVTESFPACSGFTSSCLVMAPTMAVPLLLCSSAL